MVLKIVGARSVYVPDILRQLAGTEFSTQEGTLYPLLSKLRREELVQYEWQESDAGPPRKYYRLTDAGRAQLAELDEYDETCRGAMKVAHALVPKVLVQSGGFNAQAYPEFRERLSRRYPWMSEDNAQRLFSQGCYYAMK